MIDPRRFERNLGFITNAEQSMLHGSVVSIAGAGGDGGMLAEQLARLGVGEIRLADPDPFEIENINRQAFCSDSTLGQNKAHVVAAGIKDINPDIEVKVFDEGVHPDNLGEFVEGSTLIIDETEFTLHGLAVGIAREARKRKVPNLTALNIGFGTVVTTYHPDGPLLEERLGFKATDSIDFIASREVGIDRWAPYLPSQYGDISVLEKVAKGSKSAPSIAPGVAIAAATGSAQALLNILKGQNNRPDPVYAPKALLVDVMAMEMKKINYSRLSHYRYLGVAVVRNLLKLNPKADY